MTRQLIMSLVAGALLAWAGSARAEAAEAPDAQVEAGLDLLTARGCLGCHSTDGTRRVGPPLLGRFGAEIAVLEGDTRRTVVVDEAYIRRSIREPAAQVAEGFPGAMPPTSMTAEEEAALLAALRWLAEPEVVADKQAAEGSLLWLVLSSLLFVFGHLGLSSVRGSLIARMGEDRYTGLYSLVVLAALCGMVYGYIVAPFVPLWEGPAWLRWPPLLVMPIVMIMQVVGFKPVKPGPDGVPVGIHSITRHPGQVSTAAWALLHLPPNGDLAAVVLFGSLLTLATVGVWHIEHRKRREQPDGWDSVLRTTSVWPFVAAAQGRCRVDWRGIGLGPVIAGIVIYVVVLFGHVHMFGADPMPW